MAARSRRRAGPSFARALEQMKRGAPLKFEFDRTRPVWSLGDESVSAEVVTLLLACREIEADADTLFPNTPAQVWRLRSK
jgi:hypothetical protein